MLNLLDPIKALKDLHDDPLAWESVATSLCNIRIEKDRIFKVLPGLGTMIAMFENEMEAHGEKGYHTAVLEKQPLMARDTRDCQEVFAAGERTFYSFTTLQKYTVVARKHSKDELETGIGRDLRYPMRQRLKEPQFYDSPEGRFTQLALALKTTVHVALLCGQMCKKDSSGAASFNAVLEYILPTLRALRGDTWEEVWTVRLTLLDTATTIQENLTVSNILDCIHITEDID